MKYQRNEMASFFYSGPTMSLLTDFFKVVKNCHLCLEPFRGNNEEINSISMKENFSFYPTVKKTTLFYHKPTDCFIKILHPLTYKQKISYIFKDRAKDVYILSEQLTSKNIKVPEITAYGYFRKERKPFFVMKRLNGKSLYNILIKERLHMPKEMYRKIVEEIARFHNKGYWFGDAHLSHIFMDENGVSGFIDIDGIRRNRPFRLKNPAKDLAGLNHPELPFTEDENALFLNIYMDLARIHNKKSFMQMVKKYTERRWKE